MRLDVRSLLSAHLAMAGPLLAIAALHLAGQAQPGVAWLIAALAAHAVALAMPLWLTDPAMLMVAHLTLMSIGFALQHKGLAALFLRRSPRGSAIVPPAIVCVTTILAATAPTVRETVSGATIAIQQLAIVVLLARVAPSDRGRPVWSLAVLYVLGAELQLLAAFDPRHAHAPDWQPAGIGTVIQLLAWYMTLLLFIFLMNHRARAQLQDQLRLDALTGLSTRRSLFELGTRAVQRAQHGARPVAVLMMDLDHFKVINDKYGHRVGDDVLAGVAGAIRATLRPTDLIGRYGGEEFVAVLADADAASAALVAQRIRAALHKLDLQAGTQRLQITASIGAAICDVGCFDDFATLVQRADDAMYRVKAAGRDGFALDRPTPAVRSAAPIPLLAPAVPRRARAAASAPPAY